MMLIKKTLLPLVLMIPVAGVIADEYNESQLKKLFTDKKERDYIDALRSGKGAGRPAAKVTVNGYVKRSHGKDVVWVNNRSTLKGNKVDDVRVNPYSVGKNKAVVVSSEGSSRRLKPGETWDKQTGKVVDSY